MTLVEVVTVATVATVATVVTVVTVVTLLTAVNVCDKIIFVKLIILKKKKITITKIYTTTKKLWQ